MALGLGQSPCLPLEVLVFCGSKWLIEGLDTPESGWLFLLSIISGTYVDFEEKQFPTGGLMNIEKRQESLLLLESEP